MGVCEHGGEGREEPKGRRGKSLLRSSSASSTLDFSASHPPSLRCNLVRSFLPFGFQLICHLFKKALPALKQPLLPSYPSLSVILPCLFSENLPPLEITFICTLVTRWPPLTRTRIPDSWECAGFVHCHLPKPLLQTY